MKINKKSVWTKKKTTITAAILVAVIGSVGAAAFYKVGPFSSKDDSVNLDKASDDQKKAGDSSKKSTVAPNEEEKSTASGSDPLPEPTPSDNGGKSTVGAEITAANQDPTQFHIRTLIQTVTSSGTCALSMSGPGGKTYTATAEVQAMPSSTTCRGFDIPLSSLAPGSWTIKVVFDNAELTATASKTVTIQ